MTPCSRSRVCDLLPDRFRKHHKLVFTTLPVISLPQFSKGLQSSRSLLSSNPSRACLACPTQKRVQNEGNSALICIVFGTSFHREFVSITSKSDSPVFNSSRGLRRQPCNTTVKSPTLAGPVQSFTITTSRLPLKTSSSLNFLQQATFAHP